MIDNLESLFHKIKRSEIQAELEGHFFAETDINLRSGRVFFSRDGFSVRDFIVSLLPHIQGSIKIDDEDEFETLEDAVFDSYAPEEILDWFVDEASEWLVHCWVESSMVSGDWGILRFAFCGRGYLYHGADQQESVGILSSWEPVDDEEAFRACFVETYLRLWPHESLPPNIAEFVEGPPGLMEEAIWRVLQKCPEAWSYVTGTHLREAVNMTNDLSALSYRIVSETKLTLPRVTYMLEQLKGSSEGLERLVPQKDQTELGRDLVTVFWNLVPSRKKRGRENTPAPLSDSGPMSDLEREVHRVFGGAVQLIKKKP